MRRLVCTLLFLLLFLLFGASAEEQKNQPDLRRLFPLEKGRVWTYETLRGTRVNVRVGRIDRMDGKAYTRLETDVQGESALVEWVRHTADRVICRKRETPTAVHSLQPPQPLLVAPAAVGTNWAWKGRIGPDKGKGELSFRIAARETIQVPAGSFVAWRVEATGRTSEGGGVRLHRWYAPGVGLVREVVTYRLNTEQEVELRLLSTEVPDWAVPKKEAGQED